jgi:hypothetical protein
MEQEAQSAMSTVQSPTATLTQTLVINPAFLQEIKDSHPDCWDAQYRLRRLCHSDDNSEDRLNQMVTLLSQFRDHLALEFTLEESYGYLPIPDINRKTVELLGSGSIEKAHDQHSSLYLQVSDLCEQACDLQYRGFEQAGFDSLVNTIESFDEQLIAHEKLESDLIDQSFQLQ